jgi:hypothetical protein
MSRHELHVHRHSLRVRRGQCGERSVDNMETAAVSDEVLVNKRPDPCSWLLDCNLTARSRPFRSCSGSSRRV